MNLDWISVWITALSLAGKSWTITQLISIIRHLLTGIRAAQRARAEAEAKLREAERRISALTDRAETAERHVVRAMRDGADAVNGWTKTGKDLDGVRSDLARALRALSHPVVCSCPDCVWAAEKVGKTEDSRNRNQTVEELTASLCDMRARLPIGLTIEVRVELESHCRWCDGDMDSGRVYINSHDGSHGAWPLCRMCGGWAACVPGAAADINKRTNARVASTGWEARRAKEFALLRKYAALNGARRGST